jgi:hypothetical protein
MGHLDESPIALHHLPSEVSLFINEAAMAANMSLLTFQHVLEYVNRCLFQQGLPCDKNSRDDISSKNHSRTRWSTLLGKTIYSFVSFIPYPVAAYMFELGIKML